MIAARVLASGLRPLSTVRSTTSTASRMPNRVDLARREGLIRPFPIQVDGDYIGDHGELEVGIRPGALTIVA